MRIHPNRQTALVVGIIVLGILFLAVSFQPQRQSAKPLASAVLGDGRIVEVEALTFGTNHVVGTRPRIPKYFRKWLPFWIIQRDQPLKQWQSLQLESPGTIIWLNAVDKKTGAYVKCDDLSASILTN